MATMRRRKGGTKTFGELDFRQQTSSLQCNIITIERASIANAHNSSDFNGTLRKRIAAIRNVADRLEARLPPLPPSP